MKKLEENTERPYSEWPKKETQVRFSENLTYLYIYLILAVVIGSLLIKHC